MAIRTLQRIVPQVQDYFPGLKISDSIGHVFIRSGRTYVLDATEFPVNEVIARSAAVPRGFTGRVRDFNINISTTGTAVLMIVILDSQGNIISQLVRGIGSSQSGQGLTVMPDQAIGVAIQTAGTGTVSSLDFSGEWQFLGDNPP